MTEKTPITITVDGKEWPITLDTNDVIEAEEMTGLNLLSSDASIARPSFRAMRALLYVALRKAGAKVSLADMGSAITFETAPVYRRALLYAWSGESLEETPDEA